MTNFEYCKLCLNTLKIMILRVLAKTCRDRGKATIFFSKELGTCYCCLALDKSSGISIPDFSYCAIRFSMNSVFI